MYPDLPASEKIAQLEQAIKPAEGRALISAPKGTQAEYDACLLSLQQRYDQPRRIYQTYVQEAFERTTPHSRKGLYSLVTSLQDTMNGIELYGWMDAGSVIVAASEKGLSKRTMTDWTAQLIRQKLQPTMENFLKFLKNKTEELDEDDHPSRPPVTKQQTTPQGKPYRVPVFHT